MKLLNITGGTVKVSDRDYPRVRELAWHLSTQGYPANQATRKSKVVLLHNLIKPHPKGLEMDHIDGNKLNACRSNLRIVGHAENQWNRTKLNRNNCSSYRGVSWDKERRKWKAQINYRGKREHLGRFISAIEAHQAYEQRARELYKQYLGVTK